MIVIQSFVDRDDSIHILHLSTDWLLQKLLPLVAEKLKTFQVTLCSSATCLGAWLTVTWKKHSLHLERSRLFGCVVYRDIKGADKALETTNATEVNGSNTRVERVNETLPLRQRPRFNTDQQGYGRRDYRYRHQDDKDDGRLRQSLSSRRSARCWYRDRDDSRGDRYHPLHKRNR
ncbi:hypothetical protein BCR43DRAFT_511019 [Syncephalastrum racemosum]|uniref:RRM domain-containing protein n=1 Tax=Syncephalastrum racemosum TaxID=13706 RepID=A0A1X2HKK6_SYNRA|nr:hypothetical protein BCR43DRAFT_511019 [Syncephalastrum racemosum]